MHKKTLYNYLQGNATELEIESIYDWIDSSENNKEEFIALKKAWALDNPQSYDGADWEQVKNKIHIKPKQPVHFYKYAAAILILLSIGGMWFSQNTIYTTEIEPNSIVLEIEDGSTHEILETESSVVKNLVGMAVAVQSKNELVYNKNQSINKVALHTIKVPFGRTFKLTLSDGSKVHLNSGSTLTYPQIFTKGLNRVVKLTGEAYFEVEKDEAHPFIVETTELKIEVLGTKFNVSSYVTDNIVEAALVEGSVKVVNKSDLDNQVILKPDQVSNWNKTNKYLTVKEINSSDYIAWVYGELLFKTMKFDDIAVKLERTYNVKFQIDYAVLKSQKFTGTFKIESLTISELLDLIKLDTDFDYIINNNTIVINPPTSL